MGGLSIDRTNPRIFVRFFLFFTEIFTYEKSEILLFKQIFLILVGLKNVLNF